MGHLFSRPLAACPRQHAGTGPSFVVRGPPGTGLIVTLIQQQAQVHGFQSSNFKVPVWLQSKPSLCCLPIGGVLHELSIHSLHLFARRSWVASLAHNLG